MQGKKGSKIHLQCLKAVHGSESEGILVTSPCVNQSVL